MEILNFDFSEFQCFILNNYIVSYKITSTTYIVRKLVSIMHRTLDESINSARKAF